MGAGGVTGGAPSSQRPGRMPWEAAPQQQPMPQSVAAPGPAAPQASTHTVGQAQPTVAPPAARGKQYSIGTDFSTDDGAEYEREIARRAAQNGKPSMPAGAAAPGPEQSAMNGLMIAAQGEPSEGFAQLGPGSPLNPNLGRRLPVDPANILSQLSRVY